MRVLVTNTHTPQAYAIVRALRPHASRIVAAVEGPGWRASLSHAAWSRLVDARCRLPSLVDEWTSGRLAGGAGQVEQQYVSEVLRVAGREGLDVVFPSWDPYVAVLARHRDTFETHGITIPVPPFDTAEVALDKLRTITAARGAGVPCPRTYVCESPAQLSEIEKLERYPLVVKPRFTSGGRGMAIVRDGVELRAALPGIEAAHGRPLIQEYIPGGRRSSVQFVVDRHGEVVFAFRKLRHRTFRRTARFGTASESAGTQEHVERWRPFLRSLGVWGALGIETIRDPRDGADKLMEINLRFPRQLWNRTEAGVNEPLLCIRIARGEPTVPVPPFPPATWFVSPVEDVALLGLQLLDLFVHTLRTKLAGGVTLDPAAQPLGAGAQLRSFTASYARGKRRVWDPYSRHLLHDPAVSLLWWLQFSTWVAGTWREIGR